MENDNVKLTKQWIERFVIGLRLCPFAQFSFYDNTILYELSSNIKLKVCLEDVMNTIVIMNDAGKNEMSNAFIIFNESLTFDFMLKLKEKVDYSIEHGELEGIYQTVVFHPEFQFADENFYAHGNFTNRSPLPMIHVLRVDEVAHAIEVTDDADQIPIRNKIILEKLKIKNISEVFEESFIERIKQYI